MCLSANVSLACSCFMPGAVSVDELLESPLVFYGTAIEVEEVLSEKDESDPFSRTLQERRMVFRIDQWVKGEEDAETVVVTTQGSSSSCGIYVKQGESWVIWTYEYKSKYYTGLCTRSSQVKNLDKSHKRLLKEFQSHKKNKKWCDAEKVHNAHGSVKNGRPYGSWEVYYPDESIKYTGSYIEGNRHGIWKYYATREEAYRWMNNVDPPDGNIAEEYAGIVALVRKYDQGELIEEKEFIPSYSRRRK